MSKAQAWSTDDIGPLGARVLDELGEAAIEPGRPLIAVDADEVRIVDGAGAVGFLKHIKECIEDPERLMLEV